MTNKKRLNRLRTAARVVADWSDSVRDGDATAEQLIEAIEKMLVPVLYDTEMEPEWDAEFFVQEMADSWNYDLPKK